MDKCKVPREPINRNNGIGHAGDESRANDATTLFEMVRRSDVELWRDHENEPYCTIPVNGHYENYSLDSRTIRLWVAHVHYERFGKAIRDRTLSETINALKGCAIHNGGSPQETYIRCANVNGKIYLDMTSDGREAVEIGQSGWRIVRSRDLPVKFLRPNGARPLPSPHENGNIVGLRNFLNTDNRGFMFCVAWLLVALNGRGPFPVLFFNGEQGCGKSSASKVVRALVDPNVAPIRTPPRDIEGIRIAAANAYVLAFDNMSSMPQSLSDGLCRLSTGAGFSDRRLYTDKDEVVFHASRPIIINSIPDVVGSPDLVDRTLNVPVQTIAPNRRQPETEFWEAFERERPAILGGLLTALADALRSAPLTNRMELQRMADFVKLIVCAEGSLPWPAGNFLDEYKASQRDAAECTVGGDPVGALLKRAVSKGFQGTTSALLARLEAASANERYDRRLPGNPESLAHCLRRLAPALRSLGWSVEFDGPRRMIRLGPSTRGAE